MGITQITGSILSAFFTGLGAFLPQFLAGLVLLLLGLVIANMLKGVLLGLVNILKVETWFAKQKTTQAVNTKIWLHIVAELVRWSVLILFLIAAVETWGISKVGELLNELLLYLPNVFVAVIFGFVGMVVANLASDVIRHSAKGMGAAAAGWLATLAYYAVLTFSALLVLNQLGVASDLIRILFTGVVAMIALAGGLAFGLGGQEMAKKLLNDLYDKLSK